MPSITSYPSVVSDVNAPVAGVQLGIGPLGAGRAAVRPTDYTGSSSGTLTGVPGGHFAVAQRSGNITVAAAGAFLARLRWTDTTRLCVLNRIRVGWTITTAVTTAVEMTMRATIVRGFSVDFSANNTFISMAGVTNTNKERSGTMSPSLMGVNGPGICTTAAMTGQTLTADAAPFAITTWAGIQATNVTGTAVLMPVGLAGPMQTIYEWTGLGQHPIVLAANEGVVIGPHVAGPADGTWGLYTHWEWSEISAF